MTAKSLAATFSNGVALPEFMFIAFQMTFACITPALIVGAFAERIKFPALLLFVTLWVTFVYFPIAHMVWYWAGPDALGDAAAAVAAATGEAKVQATAALEAATLDAGQIFQWGAIDFAGGTVVHINAGIAGLVGAVLIGKRVGYGREAMPPHSLTLTMIGAALLWVGWFGFNSGSNLEANVTAIIAMMNTFVATAAAGLAWMLAEWAVKGKPSLLGLASGVVAGLVAVTPAAGFAGPMGSIVLGLVAGVVCFMFCTSVKNALSTTTASTCSACIASAASSARSAPASSSTPISAAPASSTTRPSPARRSWRPTISSRNSRRRRRPSASRCCGRGSCR